MAEGRLTAVGLRSLKPGWHCDGGGLYARVEGSRRNWLFRYRRGSKTTWLGLGAIGDVTLAEARAKAREARRQLAQGTDPLESRRKAERERAEAGARTFQSVAELYLKTHAPSWANPKHRQQWENTLESFTFPVIGDRSVSAITTADVLSVLQPHWTRVPETASRLRGRLEKVLDFARAKGWRPPTENPARWKGGLEGLLPALSRVARIEHQPSLAWKQMPAFITALREVPGVSARALEFVIFTAARSGEVRGMTWGELDLAEAVWVIPADRMKAGRLHRVPLSEPALAMLRAMHPAPGVATSDPRLRAELVFPGRKGELSDMSISAVVKRMNGDADPAPWRDAENRPVVPHGFRSTFRDWCSESAGVAREIAESALAHVLKDKVESAYARSDHLERRRELMVRWGAFVTAEPGKVVAFPAKTA